MFFCFVFGCWLLKCATVGERAVMMIDHRMTSKEGEGELPFSRQTV